MKKSFRIILIAIMLLAVVFTLWACKDDDDEVLKSLNAPEGVSAIGSTVIVPHKYIGDNSLIGLKLAFTNSNVLSLKSLLKA